MGTLSELLKRIKGNYEIDPVNPELIVPCEFLEEGVGEALLKAFLASPPWKNGKISLALDPGEVKTGLVLAVDDEVIHAASTTPEAVKKILSLLSKYYTNLSVFSGDTRVARRLLEDKPSNVTVVYLDEAKLPGVHIDVKTRDDALDALRIYYRGRTVTLQREFSKSSL